MTMGHLLVITPGIRAYREYLLRSISRDFRVHLVLTGPPTWELAYTDGHTVVADPADVDGLVRVARAVDAEQALDGVICWDETWIEQSARVAAALGLPGGDRRCVERCRDKHRTRSALDAARVPQPRSVLVSGRAQALTAAEDIGYPVVVKPRATRAAERPGCGRPPRTAGSPPSASTIRGDHAPADPGVDKRGWGTRAASRASARIRGAGPSSPLPSPLCRSPTGLPRPWRRGRWSPLSRQGLAAVRSIC
ncbi:ATP-grasp domain-containing protein [Streptomyces sp. BBFR109]|uniref:ATP-grasp domain-containing protein n=1 Tax=Streptomyces sp. BBFR109 TaxID=3448172 RepID=UPI003F76A890